MLNRLTLISLVVLLTNPVSSAPMVPLIDSVHAEPSEIIVEKATPVLFTAHIFTDATHVPDTVRLLRLQWSGNVAEIAKMKDNGTRGDQKAGDGIYSCTAKLKEPIIGVLSFSVEVKYKGAKTPPVRSQSVGVNVVGGEI